MAGGVLNKELTAYLVNYQRIECWNFHEFIIYIHFPREDRLFYTHVSLFNREFTYPLAIESYNKKFNTNKYKPYGKRVKNYYKNARGHPFRAGA